MRILLIPCLAIGICFAGDTPPNPEYAGARSESEKNLADKQGSEFAKAALSQYAKAHARTLLACRDSLKATDTTRFDLFIKFNRRGRLKAAFPEPATPVASCLLKASLSDSFPPPPGPNYWIRIPSSSLSLPAASPAKR
jgi:hypothetical protein